LDELLLDELLLGAAPFLAVVSWPSFRQPDCDVSRGVYFRVESTLPCWLLELEALCCGCWVS